MEWYCSNCKMLHEEKECPNKNKITPDLVRAKVKEYAQNEDYSEEQHQAIIDFVKDLGVSLK